MKTLSAKGDFTPGNTPTITISGGREGIHVALRESDDDSNRSIMAWFDRDALLDAIADADAERPAVARVIEPAADAA